MDLKKEIKVSIWYMYRISLGTRNASFNLLKRKNGHVVLSTSRKEQKTQNLGEPYEYHNT